MTAGWATGVMLGVLTFVVVWEGVARKAVIAKARSRVQLELLNNPSGAPLLELLRDPALAEAVANIVADTMEGAIP